MRCIYCGKKYTEEYGDVSAGFCSELCRKLWEEQVEKRVIPFK